MFSKIQTRFLENLTKETQTLLLIVFSEIQHFKLYSLTEICNQLFVTGSVINQSLTMKIGFLESQRLELTFVDPRRPQWLMRRTSEMNRLLQT